MLKKLLSLSVLALAAAVVLSGCTVRFKGVEGFNSATTPVNYDSPEFKAWKGDPYSDGGIANGSGGRIAETNYGKGANPNSTDPIDLKLDQPAKGVGMRPGEYHVDGGNGYGITNAPVAQPTPSDVNGLSNK